MSAELEILRIGNTLVRSYLTIGLGVLLAGCIGWLARTWWPVFRGKKHLTPPRP